MTLFDRTCVNEALDVLLERENGTPGEETVEKNDARFDEEARRSAAQGFEKWSEED